VYLIHTVKTAMFYWTYLFILHLMTLFIFAKLWKKNKKLILLYLSDCFYIFSCITDRFNSLVDVETALKEWIKEILWAHWQGPLDKVLLRATRTLGPALLTLLNNELLHCKKIFSRFVITTYFLLSNQLYNNLFSWDNLLFWVSDD